MRVDLQRRLTREEANLLVGQSATDLSATPTERGTVFHDADTGEPILIYAALEEPAPLRRALLAVECFGGGVRRYNNYRSRSRTFGYAPRRPAMKREGCGLASITAERPDIAATLEAYADQFSLTLKHLLPEVVEHGRSALGPVLPEWRLGSEKLWTSGVINDTAQLPYHRDGFNFPVWSAMPVLRRGTRGGYLHLPEYGLVVPCEDASVVMFEGFRWLHGVTPITRVKPGEGYRISAVYYALRGMKNCRSAAEETRGAWTRRTQREQDMARRLATGDRSIPGIKKRGQ